MRRASTSLLARRWRTDLGDVRVVDVTTELLAEVDDSWSPRRGPADVHHAWRWREICEGQRERFGVMVGAAPAAIWVSTRTRPLRLRDGSYYRLDYLEVAPDLRGGVVGPLTLALIACRALELGADAIVLTAFDVPGLVDAYRRAGAVVRRPPGWSHPSNLVSLVFEPAVVALLKGFVDELLT